jgi:hypothetical protein
MAGIGAGHTSSGFADVVTGIALLVIATSAPFVLLRLVPAVEAGAVLHLDTTRQLLTHAAAAPVRAGSTVLQMAGSAGMLSGGGLEMAALAGTETRTGIGMVEGTPSGSDDIEHTRAPSDLSARSDHLGGPGVGGASLDLTARSDHVTGPGAGGAPSAEGLEDDGSPGEEHRRE